MTTDLREVIIKRDGRVPLRFEGEQLAFASSERDDKDRWFEIRIYRINHDEQLDGLGDDALGRYVVAGAGITVLPDEQDRYWAVICATPEEVIKALERPGDNDTTYLPKTAQHALWGAAQRDEDIRDAYAEDLT